MYLGVIIGQRAKIYADKRDDDRVERSEIRASAASKDRISLREQRNAQNVFSESEKGPLYDSGIAD